MIIRRSVRYSQYFVTGTSMYEYGLLVQKSPRSVLLFTYNHNLYGPLYNPQIPYLDMYLLLLTLIFFPGSSSTS
jgi:hypothetical protein